MNQTSPVSSNYKKLLEKISFLAIQSKGSFPVTLIAVSKRQSVDAIEELYRLGQRDFGENYVQELITKAEELNRRGCHEIRWHFIGHLQTNKVKSLIPWVSCVHTVDSTRIAQELAKKWVIAGREGRLPVFIEVNTDREETKSGVNPDEVLPLCEKIAQYPVLEVLGLMCIPPLEGDPTSRFKDLAALERRLRPYSQGMLSMGMSGDFATAIAEGATHIRVGTALFGPRIS
ncbi:MAG: YggS family pyridoxal phosphate-dependent enzyme [Bdellovibrionia bacterium]